MKTYRNRSSGIFGTPVLAQGDLSLSLCVGFPSAAEASEAKDAAGDSALREGVPGEDQPPDRQPHQRLRLSPQARPTSG